MFSVNHIVSLGPCGLGVGGVTTYRFPVASYLCGDSPY